MPNSIPYKYTLLSLFLLAFTAGAKAQVEHHRWVDYRMVSTESTGRQNFYPDFVQDTLGFLWFANPKGLCRFNGHDFQLFKFGDLGIANPRELRLEIDPNGMIWMIAFKPGLDRPQKVFKVEDIIVFDPYQKKAVPLEIALPDVPFQIDSLLVIKRERKGVLLSTLNGGLYRYTTKGFTKLFDEGKLGPMRILAPSAIQDEIYVVIDNSLYVLKQEQAQFLKDLPENVYRADEQNGFLIIGLNNYKVGGNPFKIMIYETGNGRFWPLKEHLDLALISLDNQGLLWTRSAEELIVLRLAPREEETEIVFRSPLSLYFSEGTNPHLGVAEGDLLCIFSYQGFVLFNPRIYELIRFPALSDMSIRHVVEWSDSILLLTTYSGSQQLNKNTGRIQPIFPGVTFGGYKINVRDSVAYVGNHNFSIYQSRFPFVDGHRIAFDQVSEDKMSGCIIPFRDSTGKTWIGMSKGLAYLDSETNRLSPYFIPELEQAQFYDATASPDGFWLATSKGLFHFDPYQGTVEFRLNKSSWEGVRSIRAISQDSFWIMPVEGDPNLWLPKRNECQPIPLYNQTLGNEFHVALEGKNESYWMPSNNGLYFYHAPSQRVDRFTANNSPVTSNEFNHLAWARLSDGSLAFGGIGGLILIDPEKWQPATARILRTPQLKVSKGKGRKKNGEEIPIYQQLAGHKDAPFFVPASIDQFTLELEFPAPLYTNWTYYFRALKGGLVETWTELPSNALIIDRPPSGEHLLELAVKRPFDPDFQSVTQVHLRVRAPWYRHPVTLFCGFLLLFFGVRQFLRYRLQQAEKKQRQLEQVIQERTAELQALNKAKDKLFGFIGHELKGPLMNLVGLNEKVRFLLAEEDWDTLEKISNQLDQYSWDIQNILHNLLNWGRIMVSDAEYTLVPLEIKDIIDEVIDSLVELTEKKNLRVENTIAADPRIYFDPVAIRILLRNLLHNAVKFSEPQGIIRVQLVQGEADDTRQLIISDEGVGMDEEYITRLYQPDVFMTRKGTSGEGGSGLGLRLCFALAEKNRAQLSLESHPGIGTRAIISLFAPATVIHLAGDVVQHH